LKPIHTIDDVISALDTIIEQSTSKESTLGYFAALYRKVTIKVKEGIENNFFDDNLRMERLDVVFAKRYVDAYYAYKKNKQVTTSWKMAFEVSENYWPIVLQHLLIGMNAHINLDLGIAAAQVSKGEDIENLKDDFDKINEILSSLVLEVEKDLSDIWPTLRKILKYTHKVNSFLIDFSMELARDGAWEFAKKVFNTPNHQVDELIMLRDTKVTKKGEIVTNPGVIAGIILGVVRIGEVGTVLDKINKLKE